MSQRIVFLTRSGAAIEGGGGQHRAYQIQHDLAAAAGTDQVTTVDLAAWWREASLPLSTRLQHRLRRLWFDRVVLSPYRQRSFATAVFLQRYEAILQAVQPTLALVDDARLAPFVRLNGKYGVATIACPQNLESLDGHAAAGLRSLGRDLARELAALAVCRERLAISKVETAVLRAAGLATHYYPYRPVGEVRRWAEQVRRRRAQTGPEAGLFLLLGTAVHPTTRRAFAWFLQQAERHGLPNNVRLVVAGRGSDTLLQTTHPQIERRGWVAQAELEDLLARVTAVLIPQFHGFGALTRLSELACAGVPLVVSQHPTLALDVPPGVQVVADARWAAWAAVLAAPPVAAAAEYHQWDAAQGSVLTAVVQEYMRDQY